MFDFVAHRAPGVREDPHRGEASATRCANTTTTSVAVDASAYRYIRGQRAAPQAISDLVKVGLIPSETDWILEILSNSWPHDRRGRRDRLQRRCRSTRPSSWPGGVAGETLGSSSPG